jgi:hypothetical protein
MEMLVQRMHGTAPEQPQEIFPDYRLVIRQSSMA